MGRSSYLGGSTIIHRGSGASSRRKSRPASEITVELQGQEAFAKEIAGNVTAFLYDGDPDPKITPSTLFDNARFEFEAVCVEARKIRRILQAYHRGEISSVEILVAARDFPNISVWKFEDARSRVALVAYLRDTHGAAAANSGILGIYPSRHALENEFAGEGWLVAQSPEDLTDIRPSDLKGIWQKARPTSAISGRLKPKN